MDTLPGLAEARQPTHPLEVAAQKHVARLREKNLLGEEHELAAQLVLHLATQIRWARSYALPALSKELREAMADLPAAPQGDAWDQLVDAIRDDVEKTAP